MSIQHELAQITAVMDHMPGYFILKDLNSIYISASKKAVKLLGFDRCDQMEGIQDYDLRCKASEDANVFIQQDNVVKSSALPLSVIGVHTYINEEIKTLLINKYLIFNKHANPIAIGCYCVELNKNIMNGIADISSGRTVKKYNVTENYYLNADYEDVSLSQRQSQCLFYLIRGKSTPMIASILGLSPRTIESYVEEIKNKMGCTKKSELIEKAIEQGCMEIIPRGIIMDKSKK